MNFNELHVFLRELDKEEKFFKSLLDKNELNKVENEVMKIYSTDTSHDQWIINSEKLMSPHENFTIHKHKRFVRFKEHKHDYLELIYVFSGKIQQKINGEEVDISEGEICLLDLNLYHSIEPASENDIAVNILMKKEFFDGIFMSFLSGNDIICNFLISAFYNKKESSNYLIFRCQNNEGIKNIIEKIVLEYLYKKIGSETAIQAYILLLFTELLRYYKENMEQSTIKHLNNTVFSEIKSYLSKNYKNATLKETAKHFHFNADYLSKLIKSSTGISFIELLQEIRLSQACILLEETDLSITEIADSVGYTNISYFYKLFKKKYGITPIEYRKKAGYINNGSK